MADQIVRYPHILQGIFLLYGLPFIIFLVFASNQVINGEISLQTENKREASLASLMYLLWHDIDDIKDENRALKDEVDILEKKLLDLDARTKGNQMVGFSAQLTNKVDSGSQPKTVVFDHVITNIGNGYDDRTGIFTAPVAGVYSISAALASPSSGRFFIMMNDENVGYLFTTGTGGKWEANSETFTLSLNPNDKVYVAGTGIHEGYIPYNCGQLRCYHSSFTGVLISPQVEEI